MLSLRLTKGLVLGGMFLITAFFCCLPAFIISRVRTRRLESTGSHTTLFRSGISFLNCFACGVFLGTLFLDLQPDVIEGFKTSLEALGIESSYPLAQFCTVFGFLLVLVVERIAMSCKNDVTQIVHGHSHERGTEHRSRSRTRSENSVRNNPDLLRERLVQAQYAMPNPYHPDTSRVENPETRVGDFRTRRVSEVTVLVSFKHNKKLKDEIIHQSPLTTVHAHDVMRRLIRSVGAVSLSSFTRLRTV